MDSNDSEEEDFLTAELDDPVWFEEPIPNRQWLWIHQAPCQSVTGQTPRPAMPSPQPVQEEVHQEAEPLDISILDDLPDVINVP